LTLVRSPMGVEYTEGKHGWEHRGLVAYGIERLITDTVVGFEMGFAAATRDPWDGRLKLEVLMVERS
jgi:hypothetical protein